MALMSAPHFIRRRRAFSRALAVSTTALVLVTTPVAASMAQPGESPGNATQSQADDSCEPVTSTTSTTASKTVPTSTTVPTATSVPCTPVTAGTSAPSASSAPALKTPSATTPPVTTTSTPTSEGSALSSAPQQKAPAGEWTPTENPKATVVPGQMRSDREEIPEPFTKADADKAETMEARISMSRLTAGCQVYWPSPFEVCGAIKDKYNSLGGPSSFLLWPTSAELTNPGNTGKRTQFLNGPIYWSVAGGAHPVVNSFLNRWGVHGYEAGWLGYPTTDEIVHADGIGRRQEFQGGAIYVSLPNAIGSAVGGAIRDKWNTLGAETPGSLLGYPISDEIPLPDGQGRMNRFERGVIYWHPTHGAHAVSGTILLRWESAGYEAGSYGYPTADAVQTDGIWFAQQFQNGSLNGTIVINNELYYPLISATNVTGGPTAKQDGDNIPGENYDSRLIPCMDYEVTGDTLLAAFKVRDRSAIVTITCERFRTHMAPNPAVAQGHFDNYPPTRSEWYNFLGCTFYTLNGEDFTNTAPANFGRQRGNIHSGVKSVTVVNKTTSQFVTGWAGDNEFSTEWSGCVQGLPVLWQ